MHLSGLYSDNSSLEDNFSHRHIGMASLAPVEKKGWHTILTIGETCDKDCRTHLYLYLAHSVKSKILVSGTGSTISQNRSRAVQSVWFDQSFSLSCLSLSKNWADLAVKSRWTLFFTYVFSVKNVSTFKTP